MLARGLVVSRIASASNLNGEDGHCAAGDGTLTYCPPSCQTASVPENPLANCLMFSSYNGIKFGTIEDTYSCVAGTARGGLIYSDTSASLPMLATDFAESAVTDTRFWGKGSADHRPGRLWVCSWNDSLPIRAMCYDLQVVLRRGAYFVFLGTSIAGVDSCTSRQR